MYCNNCGQELPEGTQICSKCGVPIDSPQHQDILHTKEQGIGLLGILCFLIPILGLVLFIVWKDTQRKKAKGAGIAALIGVICMVVLPILTSIAIPLHLRRVEKSRSTEAQTALSAIRAAYDIAQTEGRLEDFTLDMALKEAQISEDTLKNWKFEVVGRNDRRKYIATSTADFSAGEGMQVIYDDTDGSFHGYGINEFDNPDYMSGE